MIKDMKFDSSKQFQPNEKPLQEILSFYSLTLLKFETANSGIENTTLITECSEGKYVLRIYRKSKKSDDHILEEISYMNFLYSNGFRVPKIIKSSSGSELIKYKSQDAEWQIILMEYIEGHHAKVYSPTLIQNLSRTQARIHMLGSEYTNCFQGAVLLTLKERHFAKKIQTNNLNFAAFLNRVQDFEARLDDKLPFGLCHLDYDKHNILVNDSDEITGIIDFDDLALAPYVLDLGYSAWDAFYFGGVVELNQYLEKYQEVRPLSELELSSLKPILLFRHYVVCTLFALDGKDSNYHIERYVVGERRLQGWSAPLKPA
jgi:Ser/Thr protein kinase RdoA (MazF antagonist)